MTNGAQELTSIRMTSLETSQLTRTDADVVFVADPADVPQRYAMLTMNLKAPGTGKGLAAVDLDGRVHNEFPHRILVHIATSIPGIVQPTRL
jgi:hypothetical protein